MTVSYSGGLLRQLLRWSGSVYKAIWCQILIYFLCYYSLQALYVYVLGVSQKRIFESVTQQAAVALTYIEIEFILGFFISDVVLRWWNQFNCIAWPENLMLQLNALVSGDSRSSTRCTIARWTNLTSALVWRQRSQKIAKRFPTVEHLVNSGLMTEDERRLYDKVESAFDKWWIPTVWIVAALRDCRDANVIHPATFRVLLKEIFAWHRQYQRLLHYDWICLPLAYTQVVTVATYGYCIISLFGHQVIKYSPLDDFNSPLPIPLIALLQIIFYLGWLKVGESLLDPFGEDEEDFELHWVLDRNTQVSRMMVDTVANQLPSVTDFQLTRPAYTKGASLDHGYYDVDKNLNLKPDDFEIIWGQKKSNVL